METQKRYCTSAKFLTFLFQSRSDADKQLAHRIKDANIRAWLLMNMGQLEDGSIGWTNNINAIHDSFRKGNL